MKIIITDCDHKDIDIETKVLNNAGLNFELKQCHSEEDVILQCQDADALIVQYAKITKKVMDSLPNLKMIVRYGVGVDTIDIEEATKHNIQVCNVPDYGMNEVADHAIALMMAMTRKIVLMNNYTKQEKWDYTYSIPIHRACNQTVGVIGLGRIGRNFATKAHALGYNIIGYDPYFKESDDTKFITIKSLDELISSADIISLHIPAEGNQNLFNKETFKKMKNNAIIINVARGGIINEDDLYDALNSKEIAGAAIDCVCKEPMLPKHKLFTLDNYIATPHMAWYSEEASQELKRKVAEECVNFLKHSFVRYPINHLK